MVEDTIGRGEGSALRERDHNAGVALNRGSRGDEGQGHSEKGCLAEHGIDAEEVGSG